jgi:hypothetical protein
MAECNGKGIQDIVLLRHDILEKRTHLAEDLREQETRLAPAF